MLHSPLFMIMKKCSQTQHQETQRQRGFNAELGIKQANLESWLLEKSTEIKHGLHNVSPTMMCGAISKSEPRFWSIGSQVSWGSANWCLPRPLACGPPIEHQGVMGRALLNYEGLYALEVWVFIIIILPKTQGAPPPPFFFTIPLTLVLMWILCN